MIQPLAGVCVLDFSTLLARPLATVEEAPDYPSLGEGNQLTESRGAS